MAIAMDAMAIIFY